MKAIPVLGEEGRLEGKEMEMLLDPEQEPLQSHKSRRNWRRGMVPRENPTAQKDCASTSKEDAEKGSLKEIPPAQNSLEQKRRRVMVCLSRNHLQ
jgi:hypothetical protein